MKIDIVGAGAIGLLFGGGLALAGNQIRLWTRTPEQATALEVNGYVLEDAAAADRHVAPGTYKVQPIEDAKRLINSDKAEWILLTTKQRHIDDSLIKDISQLLDRHTKIACFQNGVGHLEAIEAAFPGNPVFAVITTEGAKRISDRHVIRSGTGMTKIGASGHASGRFEGKTAESLVKTLIQGGFPALLSNQIDKEIYGKLLINAVINPLTALLRIPNGDLLETEERRELLRRLYDEAMLVYKAGGIDVEPDLFERIVAVCRSTAGNVSSMLKDVLDGAPTEVDYINGRLVEMARAANVSAPGHETLWRLIRAMNRQ